MTKNNKVSGSFRDPSGFLFVEEGDIFRQVNQKYAENYNALMSSGLYQELVEKRLIIPHKEVPEKELRSKDGYKIIQPEKVGFISYPYEWSFSQTKDAALTTLEIQKIALKYKISLKDSSAYNIQFFNGKPVLIDTLSFEKYKEGTPWIAYRQFCQHFLSPLVLMAYTDIRLNQLMRIYIDGLPIDLVAKLLPTKTKFNLSIFSHIHLHAKYQKKFESKKVEKSEAKVSQIALMGIIDSLESVIKKLSWKPAGTEWAEYYTFTNYSDKASDEKKQMVERLMKEVKPKEVWDLGANDGSFSRISSERNVPTVAFDIDPAAVEKNYLYMKSRNEKCMLPLVLDLTNPSPGLGWQNTERDSLTDRGPVDCALSLALVHHLAISNNLPFVKIAEHASKICQYFIIEFVPKDDSQVQKLLQNREDIFDHYNKENFEKDFSEYFNIKIAENIKGTKRTLYLMEKK